ncbi:peptidoglycan DD-metalloendopeptidase family protein [Deinococcus humi]|uniref:Murein DD-endopeptidase MepM/ murein hydrolase activator NlpD n=1 Tax=Deinococcus humi TaxID=662880 RepID=A0A7W8K1V9_9DEIO|nr:M23 family metallopeptidase [Deinococcus humi]MBB5365981.1 murein DD-endopeptidase MepM/ murein hydrolase activator NlpD [Deinococcus humi]GGO39819.1 hypothetical protein GCM10008949_48450 [Deinococcus humi]
MFRFRQTVCLSCALLGGGSGHAAPVPVQAGDTLTRLAIRYSTTIEALLGANPDLRTGVLRAGSTIEVPSRSRIWTVRAGDTLFGITRQQQITLADLLDLNPGLNPSRALQIGQTLRVPGGAPVRQTNAAPARSAVFRAASTGGSLILPVQGRLTTPFQSDHTGLDLAAPSGTPIRAVQAGTVTESRFDDRTGWGWTVVVDHGDGVTTRYSHNSANLADVGQRVEAGTVIAQVGSTGNSTGPHVDYRLTVQGVPVDPLTLN